MAIGIYKDPSIITMISSSHDYCVRGAPNVVYCSFLMSKPYGFWSRNFVAFGKLLHACYMRCNSSLPEGEGGVDKGDYIGDYLRGMLRGILEVGPPPTNGDHNG